ncbi:RsmB/NOP family class I SAM-dependent RNA methyltransferase [Sphingobium subterraneum]|uniref:16S rRNA (Cytosine967-C5)-methyltransferase n=1 Tax=Sphingobium subterraneum TaxID=627688 RepID=A0A841J0M8_9SPHN|nr:RsmB/NOP family class I SAM-dependent RNA methyltransferase [Sphingobium subterraneum]MBB6123902.1 16S rRNA (cytosine967-C5)-methyltransferase [Sphingobium subterraneum]
MSRYPARPAGSARPARRPNRGEDAPGVAARRAALRLLDAVLRRGDPLETALHAATQGLSDRADRALAHAIAADVLRRMGDLDTLIDSATSEPLPEDAKARMVLRIALVQLLILGTPPHAAIATALPLLDGGPRRLVHGILGTLIRNEARLPDVPSLPEAVAARWAAQWDEATVDAAARSLGGRAPIDITLADPAQTAHFAEVLGGESLASGHVRVDHAVSVPTLAGFDEGQWWVQDLAASLPARLAGAGEGRRAIDLCAAPGGKTMQLATQGWRVTALDKSAKRLERMTQNMARSGLDADVVQSDALGWAPDEPADLILLDAPCSATGIFRRHPDVLYRAGPRQIAELAEQQAAMLDRAADWVVPGGMLIYATCSLERAEGEDQITAFLGRRPYFRVAAVRDDELPTGVVPTVEGFVRTLPGMLADKGGIDGFFVARLVRGA